MATKLIASPYLVILAHQFLLRVKSGKPLPGWDRFQEQASGREEAEYSYYTPSRAEGGWDVEERRG